MRDTQPLGCRDGWDHYSDAGSVYGGAWNGPIFVLTCSASATGSGSTSGGWVRHFALVRRRSARSETASTAPIVASDHRRLTAPASTPREDPAR